MSRIPLTAKKELLHFAYLSALTAQTGIDIAVTHTDYEKTDCILTHPGYVFDDDAEGGPMVKVQLKATSNLTILKDDQTISFGIDQEFCRLAHTEKSSYRFLFVLHCPEDETLWTNIDVNNQNLTLQHIMYWASIRELPQADPNFKKESKKIVYIPKKNVIDCITLKKILSSQANRNLDILYKFEV